VPAPPSSTSPVRPAIGWPHRPFASHRLRQRDRDKTSTSEQQKDLGELQQGHPLVRKSAPFRPTLHSGVFGKLAHSGPAQGPSADDQQYRQPWGRTSRQAFKARAPTFFSRGQPAHVEE